MSTAAVTYTFAPSTTILSAEANTNFADLVDFLNNSVMHLDASSAFTAIPSGPATDPTTANQFTRKAYVDGLFPAPATYTPTNSNVTVGNGTQTARYLTIGKLVYASYSLTGGTTTSFAGIISIGLPVAAVSVVGGGGNLRNFGTQSYTITPALGSTTTVTLVHGESGGTGRIDNNSPFTFGNDDTLQFVVLYEKA